MKSEIEFLKFQSEYSVIDIETNILEIVESIEKNIKLFDDGSVEYGKMGLALFYFYCYQHFKDEKYLENGEELIRESIIVISNISNVQFVPKYRGDSLSNVISSFGKGLLFIQYNWKYDYDFEDFYNIIEEALEGLTLRGIEEKDFDFFSGAISSGYFFLNRYYYQKNEKSKEMLRKIYMGIQDSVVYLAKDQVYWKSSCVYNYIAYLGISHGSAMIINFISKLIKLNVIENNDLNKDCLNKAVNFIMNQKRDLNEGFFPNFFSPVVTIEEKRSTNLGICYGDLGVLYSLYKANEILQDFSLQSQVESMLMTTARRKMNKKHTYDAALFYGASGIFCVFKELYEKTKILEFKEAYLYWFKQIMDLKEIQNEHKAGYTLMCTPKEANMSKSDEFSLGWGLAGIGISLLIGINAEVPTVEEVLLLGKNI